MQVENAYIRKYELNYPRTCCTCIYIHMIFIIVVLFVPLFGAAGRRNQLGKSLTTYEFSKVFLRFYCENILNINKKKAKETN